MTGIHRLLYLQLRRHLLPRAEGCAWKLAYSTDKHGYSLKTLYRMMAGVDSPVLLVIRDSANQARSAKYFVAFV